jgi:hypothetical protein
LGVDSFRSLLHQTVVAAESTPAEPLVLRFKHYADGKPCISRKCRSLELAGPCRYTSPFAQSHLTRIRRHRNKDASSWLLLNKVGRLVSQGLVDSHVSHKNPRIPSGCSIVASSILSSRATSSKTNPPFKGPSTFISRIESKPEQQQSDHADTRNLQRRLPLEVHSQFRCSRHIRYSLPYPDPGAYIQDHQTPDMVHDTFPDWRHLYVSSLCNIINSIRH